MSLTIPTAQQLLDFWGDEAPDEDDNRLNMMLDLAADLLWLAVEIDDDPTDPRLASLVKYAIMDMAIYLYASREDIDAEYSPFNSERVGSYSYAKTFGRVSSSVNSGLTTSVPLFDRVVEYFKLQAMGSWATSEQVYSYGFVPLSALVWLNDPFFMLTRSDIYGFIVDHNRTDY